MDNDFSINYMYKLPDEQEEERKKSEECKYRSISPFYNKLKIPDEPEDGEENSIVIRSEIKRLTK